MPHLMEDRALKFGAVGRAWWWDTSVPDVQRSFVEVISQTIGADVGPAPRRGRKGDTVGAWVRRDTRTILWCRPEIERQGGPLKPFRRHLNKELMKGIVGINEADFYVPPCWP